MEEKYIENKSFRATSRRKRTLLNTILSFSGEIILVVIGMLVPRAIMVNYGSTTNGLVTSLQQIISYFTLFEAGIYGTALFSLYKPMSEHNIQKINKILASANRFFIKIGFLFIAMLIILGIIYPLVASDSGFSNIEVFFLILVVGLNIVFQEFAGSKYKVALMASQKNWQVSAIRTTSISLYYIIIVVLSYLKFHPIAVYGIAGIAFVFRSLLFYIVCKKQFPGIYFHSFKNEFKFKQTFDVLSQQILSLIVLNSPVLIMAFAKTDLNIVSVYTTYNLVLSGIYLIVNSLNNSLLTSFGNLVAEKKEKVISIYREFEIVFQMLWSVIVPCLAILLLPFIEAYTSGIQDVEYSNIYITIICVCTAAFWIIRCQQTIILSAKGDFKSMRYGAIMEASLVVVFSVVGYIIGFLISPDASKYLWGLIGLLFGRMLGIFARAIEIVIVNNKKQNMNSFLFSIWQIFLSILTSIIGYSVCYWIFSNYIIFSNLWLNLVFEGFLSLLINILIVCLIRFFIDKKNFLSVIEKAKFFKKRKKL